MRDLRRTIPWVFLLATAPACSHLAYDRESAMTMEKPATSVVQQTKDPAQRRANPLYLPARRILADEFGTPELKKLVEEMHRTMQEKGGIGIAANQVGKRLQIFLLEAKPTNPRYQVLGEVPFGVYINPRIVAASAERRNFWHGCLSAEGAPRGNVATYEWIDVEAADETGAVQRKHLTGLAAVIFQHELRHLLGGTYLDKAGVFLNKEELDRKLATKELPFFEPVGNELPLLLDDYRVGETLEEYYARIVRG